MGGVCLAAGGVVLAFLPITAFTLAWDHSIEKIRWEEDYLVDGSTLRLVEARIRGTGAGMEPPEGAVLADGTWRYRPDVPALPRLVLARSGAVKDYELCARPRCEPLGKFLGADGSARVVEIAPCDGPK